MILREIIVEAVQRKVYGSIYKYMNNGLFNICPTGAMPQLIWKNCRFLVDNRMIGIKWLVKAECESTIAS